MSTLVITQVKSANGTNGRQRDTLRSLGLRGIGKTVERPDSEPLRGMVHAVRHLDCCRGEVVSEQDAVNEELAAEAVGLHNAEAGSRLQEGPQARRSRPWLRPRQDVRPRPQGLQLALRRQAARTLRGRPEPAPHADAQAARPEQEDVDAVRDVPDAHAAREPGRSRGALRRRRDDRSGELLKSTGLAKARDVPVKILGRGELTKKFTVQAHKFSAERAREHRGRRRHRARSSRTRRAAP